MEKIAGKTAAVPLDSGKSLLARVLRFRDLVVLVIGTVIGSGIFLVPGAILRQVGNSVPLATAVWLIGGLLSLLGALTCGELSAMKPQAGGVYVYIRDCFGPFVAFLFGWTLFFVISSGSIATLAVAFCNYSAELVPLNPLMGRLLSVVMITVIALVNVLGTRRSADLQDVTTAVKVAAIVLMASALLGLGKGSSSVPVAPHDLSAGGYASGFGLAMISVLWAYEGWQYATFSAGEAIDPQRNFPLAFFAGSVALIAIYLLANFGYLAALGPAGVSASDRVAAAAVSRVIGPAAAKLVALTILVSIFSATNGIVLTASRVYYAMAQDGLFFKRLAEVHPRFKTPAFAVVACCAWSSVLAVTGTFEQLLTYVVFIGWIFYALAAGTIFVYRKREPEADRPYRVPGYPFTPALFIAAAAYLVINTVVTQPRRAATGIVIVLLGAPAYAIWRRKERAS